MSNLLDGLNDRQREAAEYFGGPLLILAGAGSGKTSVLTTKVAYLIEEKGINPKEIVAITFTNKAAKEMRDRVENKIGTSADSIFIGTFHSFGLRILRENYREIGYTSNITILDGDEENTIFFLSFNLFNKSIILCIGLLVGYVISIK